MGSVNVDHSTSFASRVTHDPRSGFTLLLRDRYLLLIACAVLLIVILIVVAVVWVVIKKLKK